MAQVPISISKNTDMNFGTIAASSGGTVVLSPSGSRTASGGVILPSFTGTVSAAQFTVSGQANYTYAITLPATDFTLYESGVGPASMVVNAFTSTPSATGTLTGGTETVLVGATLNVVASQAAGSYTNATGFEVIVNYN
ncbi:MAG: DUF4402 domain-containing protein [Lutibacter sp.]